MKYLLVALAIVMMVQISLTNPLENTNSDKRFQQQFESFLIILKNYIPKTETIVRAGLDTIPQTEAYSKYRKMLETYLEDFPNFRNTPSNCVEKHFRKFNQLIDLGMQFEGDDLPIEAQEVNRIMVDGGIEDVNYEIENWMLQNRAPLYARHYDRYRNDQRLKSIMEEIC